MIYRIADVDDIAQIQKVRNSVTENQLSDPALVTDGDVADYLSRRGRGWVCEIRDLIIGFAIVSVIDKNVWALFMQPGFENRGIGRKLHDDMMDWYFEMSNEPVWLSTSPGTRAESFYRKAGWRQTSITKSGEIKFEMTATEWGSQKIKQR